MMLDLRRMQALRKAQGSPDVYMGAATSEGGGAFTSKYAANGEADPERPKRLLD
jgi:hypothetical protein